MDLFWETYFQASSPFPFSFASPLVASRWRRQSSCHLIVEGKGCLIFVHAVFLHRLLLISTWDDIFLIGLWTSSSSWNLWEFFLYGLVWVSMAPGELSCFLCVELPETRLSLQNQPMILRVQLRAFAMGFTHPTCGILLADTLGYSLRLPQHPMTTSESLPWHLEAMGKKGWPRPSSLTLFTPSATISALIQV